MGDISDRAKDTLSLSDYIICEDTRVTKKLLSRLSINKKLIIYNDHSQENDRTNIINLLQQGLNLSIVSDAGTPLISDPGFKLVEACQAEEIKVEPIPGP
ncbi:UNVERIFIED_CONTAM: hypothetical protein GTU68_065211, partial [Idotea baltica]|nr:hypothetical protein [Idotea baltica]